jgi:hypothetical protein
MGTPSYWYRLLLTLILAGGFFITVEEGLAKKSILDTISQICSTGEDSDDEVFSLDGSGAEITLSDLHAEPTGNVPGIEPKSPTANSRKLFLLYKQWKLHC